VAKQSKEERRVEANKVRGWALHNLSILVAAGVISPSDFLAWIDSTRRVRTLEEITAIWAATEAMIKLKAPNAETASDKERFDRGLAELVKLTKSKSGVSQGK